MANTFKFGNKQWYGKKGSVLAYNDENNNFKPLPFDFTRSSSATRVNKDGLIEVVGSDEPRVDYLNNADGHLLLEPSRTNYVNYSSALTGWTASNVSVVDNNSVSLDGTTNASKITISTLATAQGLSSNGVALNGTSNYTVSGYFKKATTSTRAQLKIRQSFASGTTHCFVDFDLLNANVSASIGTYSITSFNDDWWYVVVSTSTPPSATTARAIIRFDSLAVNTEIVSWGIQLEQGSYATSYIPTSGSSVTRIVDDADNTSTNALSLSNSASFYWNVKGQTEGNADNNTFYVVAFATDSSTTSFSYFGLASTATEWRLRIQDGSTSNFKTLTGISKFDDVKVAVVLNASTYSIYANGVALYTNESYNGTSPTIETIEILSDMGNENRGVIRVVELKAYNTELTSTEAIALTS